MLRRRIRNLRRRTVRAWERGIADAATPKSLHVGMPNEPERIAYDAAWEATRAIADGPPRQLPLDVWAKVLAKDAINW